MNIFELAAARPEPIADAGQHIVRHSRAITDCADRARELTAWEHEWSGVASSAAVHRAQGIINPLDILGMSAHGVGGVFLVHGSLLNSVCGVVRGSLMAARMAGMTVGPDGSVTPGLAGAIPGVGTWAMSAAQALSTVLRGALQIAKTADAAASAALAAALAGINMIPSRGGGGWSRASDIEKVKFEEQQNPFGKVRTYGDLKRADEVITLVSGVGSSGEESQAKTDLWARNKVAEATAEGKKVAIVTWHGYPAPKSVPEAVSPSAAKGAAGDLREFQRELRERAPNAKLHVVGYSYGSTVVGLAGKRDETRSSQRGDRREDWREDWPGTKTDGLEADEVTLWGSPGAGVRNVEQMELLQRGHTNHGANITSERVPGDLIGAATTPLGGALGRDPMSPLFGAGDESGNTAKGAANHGTGMTAKAKTIANGWGEYLWRGLTDMYLWGRGETNSHSSYLWDVAVNAKLQ